MASAEDLLILVDPSDRVLGYETKLVCHDGEGVLHRAFSVFIFNPRGELLLQQRSADKRLWPLHWSNSCCSHPRRGETRDEAAARRVVEELGMTVPLTYLYQFEYHARFGEAGSERELCAVYVGSSDAPVRCDPTEIAAWRFVSPGQLDDEVASAGEHFTPWFKLEWARLRADYGPAIRALLTREED